MEKLPKPTTRAEVFTPESKHEIKKPHLEQMAGLANRVLEKEAVFEISPHRRNGLMLMTFLALAMTLGAEFVEARSRRGFGGSLGREVVTNSIAMANNKIVEAYDNKILEVNEWYQTEIARMIEEEGRLNEYYNQRKKELREMKDQDGLIQLENDYHQARIKLAQVRQKLKNQREIKLTAVKTQKNLIRGGVGILRGVR